MFSVWRDKVLSKPSEEYPLQLYISAAGSTFVLPSHSKSRITGEKGVHTYSPVGTYVLRGGAGGPAQLRSSCAAALAKSKGRPSCLWRRSSNVNSFGSSVGSFGLDRLVHLVFTEWFTLLLPTGLLNFYRLDRGPGGKDICVHSDIFDGPDPDVIGLL